MQLCIRMFELLIVFYVCFLHNLSCNDEVVQHFADMVGGINRFTLFTLQPKSATELC